MTSISRSRFGFRHRIQEITLSPTPSKYPIELELLIDDTPVYGLPVVAAGNPLRWDLALHPCDVQSDSKIRLKFIEKHFPSQRNRVGYAEYFVVDVGDKASIHFQAGDPTSQSMGLGSSAKRWDHGGPFAVSLTFPDRNKVDNAYLVALYHADTMMESKRGPLEGLGRFRNMFKTLIDVGKLAAEMNSSAKLVVGLCVMVWERLEKLQRLHDDLRKLLGGLERMIPFIEFVKEHATNDLLGGTVTGLLNLIEDASNFMLGYLSDGVAIRFLRSTYDGRAPDRVGELLQQLTDLKEDFDRSVRVQLLASVLTSAQRALIDRLDPAARSHYDHTSPCQTGTRKEILANINQWLDDQNTTEKLLWLYGHAGQGKSSIASSICTALDEQGTLGAHFFCKRDDPDLRSPERILNTIIHRLAMKYKAYGHAVSSAIDDNTELPNSSLQNRYNNLVERPLQALALNDKRRSEPLVVIVDALDECDRGTDRRSLLTHLRGLSTLLPWVKVIVTSRPDQDIRDLFGESSDPAICARNVHDYNASDDIYAYTRKQLTDIAAAKKRTDWSNDTVNLLSQRADGLFIWAATACRFISAGVNPNQRLNQILEGTGSSGSSDGLDELYATAIRRSMDSEDQDNIEYTRQCIAAIVAAASRTPLSVAALEALVSDKLGDGTLRGVVDHLGSVLYEDVKKGNAVRVYHPSFADYVTNPARSKEFHVTAELINTTLAGCCLSTMLRELRFNICGLETSDLLNCDVPDLEARVRSAIGEHLEYSCVHWSSHLTLATQEMLNSQLGELLLGPVLLFWIETLSLLSRLSVALLSLQKIMDKTSSTSENYAGCVHDAYRFVLAFYDAISESTPHLYISALPLAPKKSMIAERMRPLFPNMLKVAEGGNEQWSTCLRTISLGQKLFSVAISPDGHLIATSISGAVQLWDAETGEPVSSPLESAYGGLAFSHDGRLLFCRLYSGGIQVWDVDSFKPAPMTLPTTSPGNLEIALSCNDRLAVTSPNGQAITIWDLISSNAVFDLVGHTNAVVSIAFSPNGRLIASASHDYTMRVWNADNGATLFDRSDNSYFVDFSPDSRHIVSSGWNQVQIWDTMTYTQTTELHVSDTNLVLSVAYSPDGETVAVSLGDSMRIWDLRAASASPTLLLGHTDNVNSVMFSPNNRHVISGSYDGTVRIWDVDTQPAMPPLQDGHSAWINHVVFSPDDRRVLSVSSDNTVGIWDVSTGCAASDPIVGPAELTYMSISPDSQRVITQGEEGLHTWDISSKTSTALSATMDYVSLVAFSGNGLQIASVIDGTNILKVHDVETGAELLAPIATGQAVLKYLSFSPCGRFIASSDSSDSSNCTVCVWSAETGEAVSKTLQGGKSVVESLAFSPDGRLIAAGSDNSIQIYEVNISTLVHEIIPFNESITALVFSPDGRRMVSGSFEHTIRIWNMDLNIPTSERLLGHTGKVTSLAFSHDGSLIVSGSWDCTVRIWDAVNTSTMIQASLDYLTSSLYPVMNSSLHPAQSNSEVATKRSQSPDPTLPVSHLAHRLKNGGWVSMTEGNVLLWLSPDYQVIDNSIAQVSARHLPRYSIDFSEFVHGDRWTSVASTSIRHYNIAA